MTVRDWYSRAWGVEPKNIDIYGVLGGRKFATYANGEGYRDRIIRDMTFSINERREICVKICVE